MLLLLHKITLDAPLNSSGECLVLTELVLPRNAIRAKSALSPVSLTQGRRSFARAPFYEKALLKEKVDGRFGLKVSVTRPLKNPELNQFLRQLLATGIESSVDLISPLLIRSSPLNDLADEAADQLADRVRDEASFLATGGIDLDSATLTSGQLSIPLKLTASIRRSDLPPGPKSREKRKSTAKLYSKGSTVGAVTFNLAVD